MAYVLQCRLSASSRTAHLLPEEQVFLSQQGDTIRLDCFTHCLLVKCSSDTGVRAWGLMAVSVTAMDSLTHYSNLIIQVAYVEAVKFHFIEDQQKKRNLIIALFSVI